VVKQNRLRWYGYVLRKYENVWINVCMDYKLDGVTLRNRPKKICMDWSEVVKKD